MNNKLKLQFKIGDSVKFKDINSLCETVNVRQEENAVKLLESVGKIRKLSINFDYYFVDFPDPKNPGGRPLNLCVYPHCLIKAGDNNPSNHKFTRMFLLENDPHKKLTPKEENNDLVDKTEKQIGAARISPVSVRTNKEITYDWGVIGQEFTLKQFKKAAQKKFTSSEKKLDNEKKDSIVKYVTTEYPIIQ